MTGRDSGDETARLSRQPMVEPLQIEDIKRLRLGWASRYEIEDLEQHLRANPGLTLWVPETGEYVVGGPWRHRTEVVAVLELAATGNAAALIDALVEQARAQGKRLVIVSEHHESRRRQFYEAVGFELLEEILIYELSQVRPVWPDLGDLEFERVSVDNPEQRRELIELDHAAFPWLWWNSEGEFDNYGHSLGVEIYLGRDASGIPVAYIGVTRFRGGSWGHLDRIAVAPDRQGQGYGLRALQWAVYVLARGGARRIALSTQARNTASRRLYERFGFQRAASQDYCLWGRWIGPRAEM